MAPGGEMFRYPQHFGENVLRHGSHEWLPYSKNAVCAKSSKTNLPVRRPWLYRAFSRAMMAGISDRSLIR